MAGHFILCKDGPKTNVLLLIMVPVQTNVGALYILEHLVLVWFRPFKSSQSPSSELTY